MESNVEQPAPAWAERFWEKVAEVATGCWEWQGTRQGSGAGRFCLNGKRRTAYDVAYELTKGPITEGLFVCQTCENCACVNPEHLYLGIPKQGRPRPLEERFWSKAIKLESGCWEWQANKNNWGYGLFAMGDKKRTAHRVSYELANGPIAEGLFVCHKCDNPACVNPSHLSLGTPKENTWDMIRKGRSTLRPNPGGVRGSYKKRK